MIKRNNLDESLIARLRKIKMIVLDVDGILTDATVHMNSIGEWCRHYNVRDGWASVRLKEAGYRFAVITGAQARDVRERVQYLKVDYLFEGQKEKTAGASRSWGGARCVCHPRRFLPLILSATHWGLAVPRQFFRNLAPVQYLQPPRGQPNY